MTEDRPPYDLTWLTRQQAKRICTCRTDGQGRLDRSQCVLHHADAARHQVPSHPLNGTWPADCPQRAFVDGVAWAMADLALKGTLFSAERKEAEAEAIRRYGDPARATQSEQAGTD